MKNQKGFTGAILIGVIIILIAIGGYFAWSKKTVPITETTTTPSTTLAKVTPMSQLRQSFNNSKSPTTNELIGSTWVLTEWVFTDKGLQGGDGPDHVLSDTNGVRRVDGGEWIKIVKAFVPVPTKQGSLFWTLTFNNALNDHQQVNSTNIILKGQLQANSNVDWEGGLDTVPADFNSNGDITFEKHYGGDSSYIYQCRISNSSQLVCLLKGPEDVSGLIFSKISFQADTTNQKTYTNTQYGFTFQYPKDENVIFLNDSAVFQNNTGQKIISLQIKNIQDVSDISCVQGIDIKCDNILADGHNIVVKYNMLGATIVARADLSQSKSVFFSLSCDSIEKAVNSLVGTGDYCVISIQRQNMFKNSLSTFKFTK